MIIICLGNQGTEELNWDTAVDIVTLLGNIIIIVIVESNHITIIAL